MKKKIWYDQGLYFRCIGCSLCCTGASGYVWLSEKDIDDISSFLKITKDIFIKKYTRFVKNKISLKELYPCYSCIFLRDKKCIIYPVRPRQCKTFPFWDNILQSKKSWENCKKQCPGIESSSSYFYTKEKIQKILKQNFCT